MAFKHDLPILTPNPITSNSNFNQSTQMNTQSDTNLTKDEEGKRREKRKAEEENNLMIKKNKWNPNFDIIELSKPKKTYAIEKKQEKAIENGYTEEAIEDEYTEEEEKTWDLMCIAADKNFQTRGVIIYGEDGLKKLEYDMAQQIEAMLTCKSENEYLAVMALRQLCIPVL